MENFNKLMSCLKEIDPDTCPNISVPLDLTVKARTLQEYASEVGQLWKNIIEIMVTSEPVDTANFVRMVCETVQGESAREDHEKILLAVNVLERRGCQEAIKSKSLHVISVASVTQLRF